MQGEPVNPRSLPRGHPLREKFESDAKMGVLENVEAQKLAISEGKLSKVVGENEKIFTLHHEFIGPGMRELMSPDFVESLNKLLALSNIKDNELQELEYHFDILALKEINYSQRSEYTPAKSRGLEIMRTYFYAQIRRARNGWEREMEVSERKILRSEMPNVLKKKKSGMFGKLFGGD